MLFKRRKKLVNPLRNVSSNLSKKHLLKICQEQVISIIWVERMGESKELLNKLNVMKEK